MDADRASFPRLMIASVLLALSFLPRAAARAAEPERELLDKRAALQAHDWWDNRDWDWYEAQLPFFECPDPELTKTYYYRWELITKHLTYGSPQTGYVFTEFIDRPFWSGTYGSISCPAGHQIYEVRWLRDPRYARDYTTYWFRTPGAEPRRYSTWLADSAWALHQVHPHAEWLVDLLPDLRKNHQGWEREHFVPTIGLFWQTGHDDGMETNINSRQTVDWFRGAPGYRPTLNSYLWADAQAIARVAELAGDQAAAREYREKAAQLKSNLQRRSWDASREFYFHVYQNQEQKDGHTIEALDRTYESGQFRGNGEGRELLGYVPWQFQLPDAGHEQAWKFLMDPKFFYAPFGPTTVGRNDPMFLVSPHCCVWSGQSWPYATTQTLKAMANLLQHYPQGPVTRDDYYRLLSIYSNTHRKQGRPYLAEAAHPDTGSWEGHDTFNHSEHYFHSGFVDLIITGLVGLVPRDDDQLEIRPLAPTSWDYFALVDVPYRGQRLSIAWDRQGDRYGMGPGLHVLVNGRKQASSRELQLLEASLAAANPATGSQPASPDTQAAAGPTLQSLRTRRVNYAVNNDAWYFPRAATSDQNSIWPLHTLIDGNYWYLQSPPNRWVMSNASDTPTWISLDLGVPRTFDAVHLYWLEDAPEVMPPSEVQLESWNGSEWQPIRPTAMVPDRPTGRRANRLEFPAVTASRVRVTFRAPVGQKSGLTELEVWGTATGDVPAAPLPAGNLARAMEGSEYPRLTASFTSRFDDIKMAHDGLVSFRPGPHNRWTSYESKSASDWLELDFGRPTEVGRVELAIYSDGGGVQAPESYGVEFWDGAAWRPAQQAAFTPPRPAGGQWNEVRFTPVRTARLRVTFQHRGEARSGVSEILAWAE
jgi:hypothetical protein